MSVQNHEPPADDDEAGPWARLLAGLGLNRPELRAWAMYDWANSAMVCTIITAVFPIYYSKVACAGLEPKVASGRLAVSTTIGMILIAVASPILGAYADHTAQKKRLLGIFLAVGLTSVAAMYFIHTGDWLLASILFIIANIGANGSFVFYDALLPHIAARDEIDRVSTAGYALGYVGGGLLLALNLAWIQKPEWFGLPSGDNLTPVAGHAAGAVGVRVGRRLVVRLLDSAVPSRPRADPRRRRPSVGPPPSGARHDAPAQGDRARHPAVSPGLFDAPGLPHLQRRHRHHLPDGDDLRRGAGDRRELDDRLDPDRPVRRHPVLVRVRRAGRQARREAVDHAGAGRLHA